MKRIFTIIAIAMGLMMPMQAQQAITKELKAGKNVEHKMMRKAPAADITVEDILGTYEASAPSAFQGQPTQEWTVNITADSKDANKVWIQPICLFEGATEADIDPVYATFNASKGTLTMPLGQVLLDANGEAKLVIGTSEDGSNIDTTSDITMSISKSNKGVVISFAEQYYFGIGDILAGSKGWWYQAIYNVTFTKEVNIPVVYIYLNGMDSPVEAPASQLFFTEVEGEMCVSNTTEYTEGGIEGTYNAYAESAFEGNPGESWTVNITADATEANKYWISPIFLFGGLPAEEVSPVYAYYDEAKGTLTMPLGQVLYEVVSYNYRFIVGASKDGKNIDTTGDLVMTVEDNFITFPEDYMIGAGNALEGEDGWWYQALVGTTYIMDATFAYPVANVALITREKPAVNAEYTYFLPGAYNWAFDVPTSETETEHITSSTMFMADEVFDLSEVFEGADGMTGIDWAITGFLAESGMLAEENPTMGALSYVMELDGTTYDVLSFIDKDCGNSYLYSVVGTCVLQDQQGNPVEIELLLGDATSSGGVSMLTFVATSETEFFLDSERPVLWYIYDGGAYLFSDMYNLDFAPATSKAPMRMKATLGEKATIAGQGTPLKVNPISLRK